MAKCKTPFSKILTDVTREAIRLQKMHAAGAATDYETLCAMAAWAKQRGYRGQWYTIKKTLEKEYRAKSWFWLINQLHRYPEIWEVA